MVYRTAAIPVMLIDIRAFFNVISCIFAQQFTRLQLIERRAVLLQ